MTLSCSVCVGGFTFTSRMAVTAVKADGLFPFMVDLGHVLGRSQTRDWQEFLTDECQSEKLSCLSNPQNCTIGRSDSSVWQEAGLSTMFAKSARNVSLAT